jgi:hypothetical protein
MFAKTLNTASFGLPSWVTGKFNLMAVFASSNIPSRNGVGRFAIRTRCVKTEINSYPLADILVVGVAKGLWEGAMRADHVEVSWDADKSNWMVRIKSGEEVIRRHCKLPQDADEQSLRKAAQQVVHDEGYELDVAELVIQR